MYLSNHQSHNRKKAKQEGDDVCIRFVCITSSTGSTNFGFEASSESESESGDSASDSSADERQSRHKGKKTVRRLYRKDSDSDSQGFDGSDDETDGHSENDSRHESDHDIGRRRASEVKSKVLLSSSVYWRNITKVPGAAQDSKYTCNKGEDTKCRKI